MASDCILSLRVGQVDAHCPAIGKLRRGIKGDPLVALWVELEGATLIHPRDAIDHSAGKWRK
eukprot:7080876-Pyramimonas_sp.AAC.1